MQLLEIIDFAKQENLVGVNTTVNYSSENHPFVTFKDKEGEAKHIWLSKNAGKLVSPGMPVKDFLSKLKAGYVEYEDEREPQWKLCTGSEISIAEALGMAEA